MLNTTFARIAVGDPFKVTDRRAPSYMRGERLRRIDLTPMFAGERFMANAERVAKRGDALDYQFVNNEYTVEQEERAVGK